jgi:GNAT superfamily N-acetyltransferase
MTAVTVLPSAELPALIAALKAHGRGGESGADGLRLAVLEQSAMIAVARCDGHIVGYVANRHDDGGGYPMVECSGEVFPAWRGRGFGAQLVDRAVAAAAERSGTAVEVIVDAVSDDLRSVLAARGFSAVTFTEATVPVPGKDLPEATGAAFRPLRAADAAALSELYRRQGSAEVSTRGGDASIVTALRHPYLRPDRCLVASAGERIVGFALCLVYPDDPADLRIEVLCTAGGSPAVVAREVVRRAAGGFTTVSLGTSPALLDQLAPVGFVATASWTRHSLLVLPSGRFG